MSTYVSPLLDGLLKGLGQNLHVGGSLFFSLPVGGDVETHLQSHKQEVRTERERRQSHIKEEEEASPQEPEQIHLTEHRTLGRVERLLTWTLQDR